MSWLSARLLKQVNSHFCMEKKHQARYHARHTEQMSAKEDILLAWKTHLQTKNPPSFPC